MNFLFKQKKTMCQNSQGYGSFTYQKAIKYWFLKTFQIPVFKVQKFEKKFQNRKISINLIIERVVFFRGNTWDRTTKPFINWNLNLKI